MGKRYPDFPTRRNEQCSHRILVTALSLGERQLPAEASSAPMARTTSVLRRGTDYALGVPWKQHPHARTRQERLSAQQTSITRG